MRAGYIRSFAGVPRCCQARKCHFSFWMKFLRAGVGLPALTRRRSEHLNSAVPAEVTDTRPIAHPL